VRAGDRLALRAPRAEERAERRLPSLDLASPTRYRVVLGPQDDYFSARGKRTLSDAVYTVSAASDRMGMRLDGPVLEHCKSYNIASDGIAPGSIQVPGNGLPIVLLADRQTTGGYPKIAVVIAADLPALGRLAPGARVAFEVVGIETAETAYRQQAAMLAALPRRIVTVRGALDTAALLGSNLVSGVVNAHDPHW
jgi:allophanate hydrolase subunit 2